MLPSGQRRGNRSLRKQDSMGKESDTSEDELMLQKEDNFTMNRTIEDRVRLLSLKPSQVVLSKVCVYLQRMIKQLRRNE